jgi:small subunit ribosomal protein S6
MGRKYEIVLFLNPELDDESISIELQELEKLAQKAGSTVINKSVPKVMEMGYIIKKKKNAYYVLAELDGDPEKVKDLDRNLRLRDNILRHTIIVKKQANLAI